MKKVVKAPVEIKVMNQDPAVVKSIQKRTMTIMTNKLKEKTLSTMRKLIPIITTTAISIMKKKSMKTTL